LAGAYLLIWSWCYREQGDAARVIQTLVFMSGINTLLQTMIGTRLPTVMGPSYAFVLPVLSIIRDYNDETFSKDHDVIIVKLT
jgi:nucleobase transporter 1/2